jgi:hypothetical protein
MAMCQDEIPIGMTGATSGRNDVSNRWFKSDEMERYARLTGQNIKRQLEVFHEQESASKPILICQGNCYDSYMKWVDYCLQEIPQSEHKNIGGVAMGAAALGTGTLEDIERAFIYSQISQMDIGEKKHLHVLGVGSAKRLMPYLIFLQSGLYDGVTMSYDSTTHTSGVELGLFYDKSFNQISFNRQYSKIYETLFADLSELFDLSRFDPKSFHKIMNSGYTKYVEELGGNDYDFLNVRLAFTVKSINNFVRHIETLLADKDAVLDMARELKLYSPAQYLYNVKTKSDFDSFMGHFKRHIKSNRVPSSAPNTLDAFFE